MKRVSTFIIIAMAVSLAFAGLSCKKKSTLGDLLIEVEASVQPLSQTDTWQQRKAAWAQDVKNAQNDVGVLKKLIIEFETNIQYAAQKASWRDRREGWMSGVTNAGSIAQLRDFLMELEGSFTFSTQFENWQDKRGDWINRLQDLQ
ncbi:MAG: hypothetical protein KBA61_11325 [Spirochaetes bacterium]|nr:hypothetical protein [Spirochaetota bacterium]